MTRIFTVHHRQPSDVVTQHFCRCFVQHLVRIGDYHFPCASLEHDDVSLWIFLQ